MITHDVEQRSEAWHALRCGIPTASEFKNLITASTMKPSASIKPYAYRLAGELLVGPGVDAWGGNADTTRGTWLEDEAADWYALTQDWYALTQNAELKTCGFITNDEKTAGCSPDMLVGDEGMLEIKCLKAEKHVAAIMHCKANGTVPGDYAQQTQGQMLIAEREWCDLLFYHANLPPFMIRATADAAMHEALTDGITKLIETRDEALAILRSI